MTTELEKTQLEIARLQLEQEKHKLAQLQKRQKVVDGLGQSSVAVGRAAVAGGSAVLRYMGRWLAGVLVAGAATLAWVALRAMQHPSGQGLVHDVGFFAGLHSVTTVTALLLGASLWAYLGPRRRQMPSATGAVFAAVVAVFLLGALLAK